MTVRQRMLVETFARTKAVECLRSAVRAKINSALRKAAELRGGE